MANTLIDRMNTLPILPNSLAIWWLGQMGVAIKGPDAMIYIDPCLSDIISEVTDGKFSRAFPPPMQPEDITHADYCFITHDHLDHLDRLTLQPMVAASPQMRFITSGWCIEPLEALGIGREQIIVAEALQPQTLPNTGLRYTAVPSAHYDKEYDPQKGYRYLGFLIEWNGVAFYTSGDTIIYDDYIETLKSLPTPDIALLAVNGRDWFRENQYDIVGNLQPAEAGKLSLEIGWDTVIVGHNDLFAHNLIPMREVVSGLERTAPKQKFRILQPGELFYYVK